MVICEQVREREIENERRRNYEANQTIFCNVLNTLKKYAATGKPSNDNDVEYNNIAESCCM